MPQQTATSVENNFTKGLITESTGLNFPENAATDTDNCDYTLIGGVLRRLGIDYEDNAGFTTVDRTGKALNAYKWNNAGGDGSSQIVVAQVGSTLYFFDSSASTIASPLSANRLASTVDLTTLAVSSFDQTIACEFTDGNGYLFVFHPSISPVYCTNTAGVITGASINIQIRDFVGIPEIGVADNDRPSSLSTSHQYNLQNQGWVSGNPWSATSTTTITVGTGAKVFTIQSGLTITPGQTVRVTGPVHGESSGATMTGTVTSYSVTTLTLSITSTTGSGTESSWSIVPIVVSQITTWNTAIGNYPSNADQWWRFKNASGVFDPVTTQANTSIGLGAAPKGHYLLNAFNQTRTSVSGITGLTDIITNTRPTNGVWFQGRIWYTGVNASFSATGTAPFTTWTENIYFSQVVSTPTDFGKCYQTNDPTSEELFDLLPTDGGIITIQGTGPIYKLFSTQNGLLVFAANGVWFITGSQGIGFTANDYTITKISSVRSISCTSFVDVLGLPYFWNEEGIYQVQAQQNGSLTVEAITTTTILSFYDTIPVTSKRLVRAAYNPVEYIIQWLFKSTEASSVTDAYSFDRILNFNTVNKAFFPYTVDITQSSLNAICYVTGPGGSNTPPPINKYLSSNATSISFADMHDRDYIDWDSTGPGANYNSFLVTGYKIRGKAITKSQPQYVQVWSNTDDIDSGYKIQGVWDYAIHRNSNRYSGIQIADIDGTDLFGVVYKRHKIRGRGYALQIKIISRDGKPFDLIGWAIIDTINQGT